MEEVKLDKFKRLDLYNQYEILKHLDKENCEHYEILQNIVANGYEGEYGRLFEHIYNEIPSSLTDEVKDTFDMFRHMNFSYENLTEEEEKDIDVSKLKWHGFDGNHEHEHFSAAHFYLNKLNLWEELGEHAINSHFTTRFYYPPMIGEWKKYGYGSMLTKEQIQLILNAPQAAKKARESINV